MSHIARMTRIERMIRDGLLRALRSIEGRIVVQDADGVHSTGAGGWLTACIDVHDAQFYRELRSGSRGMARTYAQGGWDCDDLVALVRIAARAMGRIDAWRARVATVAWPITRATTQLRNTRSRSRDNVFRHYDLGNDFFTLVLDETMGYSCAFYADGEDMEPVQASRANFDRVCRLLDLHAGERVLEFGSGWGPFALHAAKHYGAHVSTVTLSTSQRDYINALAGEMGVRDKVEVLVQDYRDVRGTWDKVVSLEMVESIGAAHLDDFAGQIGRLMRPDGVALVQAITTSDPLFHIERNNRTFINEYIFPGGHTPSLEALLDAFAGSSTLRTVAVYDITAHYPPTLRAWRNRLQRNWLRIQQLGRFDTQFLRLWTLYFSWCEAGFLERRVQDRQIVVAGPLWRDENRLLGLPRASVEANGLGDVHDGERLELTR
jgi:cyclopropane-fatty-acyl-phospholipid synthase